MGFPRQQYWSGLPFPSLGDLPDPGIEPMFPAWQVDSLPVNHLGNLNETYREAKKCDPHKRYKQATGTSLMGAQMLYLTEMDFKAPF